MKNEKRFLNVFLSVALILCSLFSFQLTSVSAEEKEKSTYSSAAETAINDFLKVPNKSYGCEPQVNMNSSVSSIKPMVTTDTIYKEAKVGNVVVKCGEKVVVPLELDSINNSVKVVVSLPEGITCEKVVDNSGGTLKIVNDDSTSEFTMTDTKAFITYSVGENLIDGEYNIDYEIIGIYYREINGREVLYSAIYNVSGGDFSVTGNSGVPTTAVTTPVAAVTTTVSMSGIELPVVPIDPVKGDANGDGMVRASDASFIAKLLAEASIAGEKVKIEDYPAADFNEDGKITAADAAAIAKYLAEQSIKK